MLRTLPLLILASLVTGCASPPRETSAPPPAAPAGHLFADGAHGEGTKIDAGNILTDLDAGTLVAMGYTAGDRVTVRLGYTALPLRIAKTVGDVPVNQDLLLVDAKGSVWLATNRASFADKHHVQVPVPVFLPRKRVTP
jgi:hypothetical protein